jgi:hypothetical protein
MNMRINREKLVEAFNPVKREIDVTSPLSVGNGELALTCDVTGLQTLYDLHKENRVPLCTMSQWGWHRAPNDRGGYYTLDDLEMTEYDAGDRTARYPVEPKPGNEDVYTWLRQNPHRLNLGRVFFEYDGQQIVPAQLSGIHQTLNLYTGVIESRFEIDGTPVYVETVCHGWLDALGFRIKADALKLGRLSLHIAFPYGSPDITASDWASDSKHQTAVTRLTDTDYLVRRTLDEDGYAVCLRTSRPVVLRQAGHELTLGCTEPELELTVHFIKAVPAGVGAGAVIDRPSSGALSFADIKQSSAAGLRDYWQKGAMLDLRGSENPEAPELQRRIILSLYLVYIQSTGSLPPQETGLTCNSWYGKFHLEMHPLHAAFLPLWGRGGYLLRSMAWYKDNLDKAKENAARNGYKGARWPKMVAYDAVDSPSVIAPLLIWQQPHLLYMLELLYAEKPTEAFLKEYWPLVSETAEFMCDFPAYDAEADTYNLRPPIIPAQEEHRPMDTVNPTFELEYWHLGLTIAARWAHRLGNSYDKYLSVRDKLALLPVMDGCYLAHENCTDTFEKFNKDHPSMLFVSGYLPGDRTDSELLLNTYQEVMAHWQFETMWGWDFALMAMTMTRLGKPEEAISILMKDTPKNTYVLSGNNYQKTRTDLPLYLPGNGALLLAVALMAAGWKGAPAGATGFPSDFNVIAEGFVRFPF